MALTLIDTPGAPDANTYCSLANAETYFEGRVDQPAWSAADDPTKERALVTATNQFDWLYVWDGWVKTETQSLLFPRYGLTKRNGYQVDDSTIPDDLREATAEFAGQLITDDRLSDNDIETLDIRNIKAGSVALAFGGDASTQVVPDMVLNMIPANWYLLIRDGRSGSSPTIRT